MFRINDDISALAADDYAVEQCVVSSDCEDVTDISDDNVSDSDYDFHDDCMMPVTMIKALLLMLITTIIRLIIIVIILLVRMLMIPAIEIVRIIY